jgi:hypothetical protein
MNTVTKRKLNADYGPHAGVVLTAAQLLQPVPSKRGKMASWTVLKPLPSREDYKKMQDVHYQTSLTGLIEDAYSVFEELASELRDWHDNLPESFQQGDKGSQLEDASSMLENLRSPDLPEFLTKLEDTDKRSRTLHLPMLDVNSRADRCSDACSMLGSAIEGLNKLVEGFGESQDEDRQDLQAVIDQLENDKSEAEGVEFPGMY